MSKEKIKPTPQNLKHPPSNWLTNPMCRRQKPQKNLGINPNTLHTWIHKLSQPNVNEREDKQLMPLTQTEFDEGRAVYGTRSIKQALAQQGQTVSRRVDWSVND